MNKTDRMRLHISLDEQIYQVYSFTLNKLQQAESEIGFEVTDHPVEQLNVIKNVLLKLFTKKECEDCTVYEKQLQKLEADIRQHIKLEHQLKLYQDSLEQKATENKKELTGVEKEIDSYKKRLQDLKQIKNIQTDQINKLQQENQQLRNQIKTAALKKSKRQESQLTGGRDRNGQSMERREITKRLQARTMMIDRAPLTKTINFNSNTDERKSVDKMKGITITQDMSKHRQSLNNKSSHLLKSGMERKKLEIVMRDKENEKRKINKVEYRR